jgi:hypothetical protein
MQSLVELNDTLQITAEQGFPADELELRKHREKPLKAEDFAGRIFKFKDKPGARIYHPAPIRVFLVHNLNGRWLYWGKIHILEQTITADIEDNKKTSGKFKITEVYDPDYQEHVTRHEAPKGLSFF